MGSLGQCCLEVSQAAGLGGGDEDCGEAKACGMLMLDAKRSTSGDSWNLYLLGGTSFQGSLNLDLLG